MPEFKFRYQAPGAPAPVELTYDTDDFDCPITGDVMENPVTLPGCNHTFEQGRPTEYRNGRAVENSGRGILGWFNAPGYNRGYGEHNLEGGGRNNHSCPVCRSPADPHTIQPNNAMKAAIAAYKAGAPLVAEPPRPAPVVHDAPRVVVDAPDDAGYLDVDLVYAQALERHFNDPNVPEPNYEAIIDQVHRQNAERREAMMRQQQDADARAAAMRRQQEEARRADQARGAFPLPLANGYVGAGGGFDGGAFHVGLAAIARANAAAERERARQETITAAMNAVTNKLSLGNLSGLKF